MSNVTSVSVTKTPRKTALPLLMIVNGALGILAAGGLGIASGMLGAGGWESGVPVCLVMAVLLLLVGVALYSDAKDKYTIKIGSASGEYNALSSTDKMVVREIAAALNQAIIERG